jgi:hypothetical protein
VRRGSRYRDRRDNGLEWDGRTITGSHTGHMPVGFPYGPMYDAAAFVPVAAAAAPNPTAIPALARSQPKLWSLSGHLMDHKKADY